MSNANNSNTVHIIFKSDVFAYTADEALAIAMCRTYKAFRSQCELSAVNTKEAREATWNEVR